MTDNNQVLAHHGAQAIQNAFDQYILEFKIITGRAKARFEERDWHGMQKDAIERLDLYSRIIKGIVADIRAVLQAEILNKAIWSEMKIRYSQLSYHLHYLEIAETFFNSVSRQIFTTVGVDPAIEFIDSDFEVVPIRTGNPIFHSYYPKNTLKELFQEILVDYSFQVPYTDLEEEAGLAAAAVKKEMQAHWGVEQMERLDLLSTVFYRGQGAYLIGAIRLGSRLMPIVLSFRNIEKGIYVDAVLLTRDEVSILFSFSRSYFHVETERPRELVFFLKSIIPLKPVAELYISLGFNKHGKTELYRYLMKHLSVSSDLFELARGEKGTVMIVFTLHSVDMVFKVIRDRFAEPKTTTRQDVMDRYQLVFKHDRAGRLVDAQEFEHMRFEKARFSRPLLEELLTQAPGCVSIEGDTVAINHLYMERRLIPLNIYIREVEEAVACEAALDYGYAIKDLALT
ncbi:MAG: bifunctional isocitrate dehydrogenase kinase/phosphatase, partial [Omnitrophica WOR_2 bacterium]